MHQDGPFALTFWSVLKFSAISKASSSSSILGRATYSAFRLVTTCPFHEKLSEKLILHVDILLLEKAGIIYGQSHFIFCTTTSFCHTFSSLLSSLGIAIGKLVQKGSQGKVSQRIARIFNVACNKLCYRRMKVMRNE